MQNSSRNMIYESGTDNLNSFAESYIMAIIYVVLTGRQWSDPLFVYIVGSDINLVPKLSAN